MGLIGAGHAAELDRYIGYYEPYAESHRRSITTARFRRRHATPPVHWWRRSG